MNVKISVLLLACALASCEHNPGRIKSVSIADRLTVAQASNGQFISWKEHIIDDTEISGIDISGSDGLSVGDLDKDGFIDIVSVHESDTEYDGALEGLIRIAFGSEDPNQWELVTLAKGTDAAAAEDVAIEDIDGDGFLDIVAACELAHLIYFQNPGVDIRSTEWERIIPNVTKNRGSFIRVFAADFNQDGHPEVISANKGDQMASGDVLDLDPISYFEIRGDPLQQQSWEEHVLINVKIPINAQPVDIDGDGDLDIIAGSRGEGRIVFFENVSYDSIQFNKYPININWDTFKKNESLSDIEPRVSGFNMDFLDVNKDGRIDILLAAMFDESTLGRNLVWLEKPSNWSDSWEAYSIGAIGPDELVGLSVADINDDGEEDVIVGGYSRGDRRNDGAATIEQRLGRLAWFEHPGNSDESWIRHDISRRKRGMFDKFISIDLDKDGDLDFLSTRGNSAPFDGVFWLEQVRTEVPVKSFTRAREIDSEEVALPQ